MISKIAFIKSMDAIVGRVLTSFLTQPPPLVERHISRILIIRPGGIGDAVLLLPVLATINKLMPKAEIHILAEQRNCAVFDLSPYVSSSSRYDIPIELIRTVRGQYDVVIDTEQWHRLSAVIARLSGAPILVGFGTNERYRLFNISVAYSLNDHETTNFRNLARAVFPELPDVESHESIFLPEQARQKAQSFLSTLTGVRAYVALFPGASVPEKRWPVQLWRNLAENLAALGMGIVLVGGKDVENIADPIMQGLAGINAIGRFTLVETTAILKRVQLLVSGDSGVLHLAWLLGIPTVSLFGPSNLAKWAPQGTHHIAINKGLSCSPCTTFGTTPHCPIDARCMRDITVDEVLNAVTTLLTSVGGMPSNCCKGDWIETI